MRWLSFERLEPVPAPLQAPAAGRGDDLRGLSQSSRKFPARNDADVRGERAGLLPCHGENCAARSPSSTRRCGSKAARAVTSRTDRRIRACSRGRKSASCAWSAMPTGLHKLRRSRPWAWSRPRFTTCGLRAIRIAPSATRKSTEATSTGTLCDESDMLFLCVAAWGQQAQQPPAPAKPETAPAGSDQPKQQRLPATERWVTGHIDFGYRWQTPGGNQNVYRSIVDLGEGPKLLDADFSIVDPKHRWFDQIDTRAANWGDDPYTTLSVTARKDRVYDFISSYRILLISTTFRHSPTRFWSAEYLPASGPSTCASG